MRAKRETPEPWATWLIAAGFVEPRAKGVPRASLRQLAERLDVHPSTVAAMVHGDRYTSEDTVEAAAEAMRVDVLEVSRATLRARTVREHYEPPAEVHSLSREVQDAISDLIRALAREHHGNAAAKPQAGGSPASRLSSARARGRRAPRQESTPPRTDESPRPAQP